MLPQAKAAAAGHHLGAQQHSGLQQRICVAALCVGVCRCSSKAKKGGKKGGKKLFKIERRKCAFFPVC